MSYLSPVSVLPAADDLQLSRCVEKQHVSATGKQSIVLLNSTDRKMYLSHLNEGPPKKINISVLVNAIFGKFLVLYIAIRQPCTTVLCRNSCD